MNDFIILEGCDGVGKTTLANLLIHKGYESLHFNYDPNLSIKENILESCLKTMVPMSF